MPVITLNKDLSTVHYKVSKRSTLSERYPLGRRELDESEKKAKEDPTLVDVPGSRYFCGSTTAPLCISNYNNFLEAVLFAYNNHIGLRLSPDDILQCVALAVTQCVNDHAEEYRNVFVRHEGKKTLQVQLDAPGDFATNMKEMVAMMSTLIDSEVVSTLGLDPCFSTTTPNIRLVSQLTKMATYKKYFHYRFILSCGIRQVELTGTLQDWQLLKEQITTAEKVITAKNHMVNWFKHLHAVVDQLILTYGGQVDENFWSRIVTFVPYGSGEQKDIGGWIRTLCPGSAYDRFPDTKDWTDLCFDIARSVVYVEGRLHDMRENKKYDLYFTTGFIGYDVKDDFVHPELGYTLHINEI